MVGGNTEFGIPMVEPETEAARIERLRAMAVAAVAAETDAEMLERFKAEERAKKLAASGVIIPKDTQGFPANYVRLEIFKGQNKQDQSYVPLGIGGFVIKVPRGEEVIVPACFVEVLEHAVEEVTIQSQGGLVTRPAHRFPYQVRGKATPEEYKVFQATQRHKLEMQQTAQVTPV